MEFNRFAERYKSAFSLMEILLALAIIAAIMVAMVPGITKRILPKKRESVIFTYNPAQVNKTTSTYGCVETNLNYDGTENYNSVGLCSYYTFIVPENVYHINLTMVGGGGGGASASNILSAVNYENRGNETRIDPSPSSTSKTTGIIPDFIRVVFLTYMTAKGKDGEYITTGTNWQSGKGGDSSPMIRNFKLPEKYMFGLNYKTRLSLVDEAKQEAKLTVGRESDGSTYLIVTNGENSTVQGTNQVKYRIDANNFKVTCNGYEMWTDYFNEVCPIKDTNFYPSVPGRDGNSLMKTTSNVGTCLNYVYEGGEGGMYNFSYNSGAGGKGQDARVIHTNYYTDGVLNICTENTNAKNADVTATEEPEKGQPGAVKIETFGYYHMPTPGGGGGSGTFIRLLTVPVTPGEKLTIVVGGGGAGGTVNKNNSDWDYGGVGTGGSSSAIIRNNKIMYLVTGGAKGTQAKWADISNIKTDMSGSYSEFYNKRGKSTRFYHKVFTSSRENYFKNIQVDEKLARIVASTDSITIGDSSSLESTDWDNVEYPLFDKEPYKTFNKNFAKTDDEWDKKYGGFENYPMSNSYEPVIVNGRYNGLYFRTLVDDYTWGYIGGGAEFSPVDGKAACPALFMGNFDGRIDTQGTLPASEATRLQYINKFTLSNGISYDINDYFSNCEVGNVNGRNGNFVIPDIIGGKYGSAGQGGSGGGNTKFDSGNGGNGAPGYVMIDWTR